MKSKKNKCPVTPIVSAPTDRQINTLVGSHTPFFPHSNNSGQSMSAMG